MIKIRYQLTRRYTVSIKNTFQRGNERAIFVRPDICKSQSQRQSATLFRKVNRQIYIRNVFHSTFTLTFCIGILCKNTMKLNCYRKLKQPKISIFGVLEISCCYYFFQLILLHHNEDDDNGSIVLPKLIYIIAARDMNYIIS